MIDRTVNLLNLQRPHLSTKTISNGRTTRRQEDKERIVFDLLCIHLIPTGQSCHQVTSPGLGRTTGKRAPSSKAFELLSGGLNILDAGQLFTSGRMALGHLEHERRTWAAYVPLGHPQFDILKRGGFASSFKLFFAHLCSSLPLQRVGSRCHRKIKPFFDTALLSHLHTSSMSQYVMTFPKKQKRLVRSFCCLGSLLLWELPEWAHPWQVSQHLLSQQLPRARWCSRVSLPCGRNQHDSHLTHGGLKLITINHD